MLGDVRQTTSTRAKNGFVAVMNQRSSLFRMPLSDAASDSCCSSLPLPHCLMIMSIMTQPRGSMVSRRSFLVSLALRRPKKG